MRPDRRRTLARWVRLSRTSFTLAAGGSRVIELRLLRRPGSGSVYGNVEVIGMPPNAERRRGITAAYRLVSSLRLNPPANRRRLRLQVGRATVSGRKAKRVVVVAVRNAGNTVEPITGSVRIQGARGTRNASIAAQRILPATIVDLRLGRAAGLPSGTYTVSVSLSQGGSTIARGKRTLRIG